MVYDAAIQITGILAALAALAVILVNSGKVKLPKAIAKLANDPDVMDKALRAVAYAAQYPDMTDDQKKEVARKFLREQLERYLREPLADSAANFLIELAISRMKS